MFITEHFNGVTNRNYIEVGHAKINPQTTGDPTKVSNHFKHNSHRKPQLPVYMAEYIED